MTAETVALARALGGVPESREEALEALCRAAEIQLAGRLREGLSPEDCGEAFLLACAFTALAGLAAGEGSVESFTAGSVTVREGSGAERPAALLRQAGEIMAPWLAGDAFAFRGVEG